MERSLKSLDVRQFFSSERMYKYVSDLASFGPRDAGSEGDRKAVDYLTSILKQWDCEVSLESCNIANFKEEESMVEVIKPYHKLLNSICHYRSGSTDSVTAELKYVGFGEEIDYKDIDVRKCIVIADLGKIHPVPKSEFAHKFGAVACLWPHFSPGDRIAAWGLGQNGAPLPVLGISYESGLLLKKLLKESAVTLKLRAMCSINPGTQDNMIIEIKGRSKSEEVVLLVAHREGTHITPGANDNGSGIAVLLELARFFSMLKPKRTLRLIFSAAEEGGGFGMRQYVDKNLNQLKERVKGVINLDMVGEGEKLCIVKAGHYPGRRIPTSDWLNEKIVKMAQSLNYKLGEWECPFGLADIGPFIEAGISSAWLYQTGDQYYHTIDDVPEHVDPNDLKVTCDITGKTVLEMLEE